MHSSSSQGYEDLEPWQSISCTPIAWRHSWHQVSRHSRVILNAACGPNAPYLALCSNSLLLFSYRQGHEATVHNHPNDARVVSNSLRQLDAGLSALPPQCPRSTILHLLPPPFGSQYMLRPLPRLWPRPYPVEPSCLERKSRWAGTESS